MRIGSAKLWKRVANLVMQGAVMYDAGGGLGEVVEFNKVRKNKDAIEVEYILQYYDDPPYTSTGYFGGWAENAMKPNHDN